MTTASMVQPGRLPVRLAPAFGVPRWDVQWSVAGPRSTTPIPPDPEHGEDPAQQPNPGDPGPDFPEPRERVDPAEDPRIPQDDFPRGV